MQGSGLNGTSTFIVRSLSSLCKSYGNSCEIRFTAIKTSSVLCISYKSPEPGIQLTRITEHIIIIVTIYSKKATLIAT